MTIEELRQLVDLCLEKKIHKMMVPTGAEFTFHDSAFAAPEQVTSYKLPIADPDLQMPNEKDLLNWSTPIEEVEVPPKN